jgi:hypothetical protein
MWQYNRLHVASRLWQYKIRKIYNTSLLQLYTVTTIVFKGEKFKSLPMERVKLTTAYIKVMFRTGETDDYFILNPDHTMIMNR